MTATATTQSPPAGTPPAGPAPPPVASTAMQAPPAARAVVAPPPPDEGGALNVFASAANFGVAQRMAAALSVTTMVPEAYRRSFFEDKCPRDWTPEQVKEAGNQAVGNCMIAIELASRIGCSVFMVMQNLDVIHGRPGWRATFLIATVNASGKFTPLRFRWEGTKGTDSWGCRAVARDKDTNEECLGTLIDWTMVKAEGWSSKNGSKWRTMAEQMFIYRAAAFWTRAYAPELSMGMQTVEEVSDISGADLHDLPKGLSQASARMLEQELLGTPRPVATPAAAATRGNDMPPGGPQPPPSDAKPADVQDADAPPPAAAATPPAAEQPAKTGKGGKKDQSLPKGDLLPATPPVDPRLAKLTPEQIKAGWDVSPDGEAVPPPPAERQPGED